MVVARHYPRALVPITGPNSYIRASKEELGVWFRHFRKVQLLGYYANLATRPTKWEKTIMTNTISLPGGNQVAPLTI